MSSASDKAVIDSTPLRKLSQNSLILLASGNRPAIPMTAIASRLVDNIA